MFSSSELQDELSHLRFGFLQPVSELLQVIGLGGTKVSMLDFHMMDTVALGDHGGKIQDVDGAIADRPHARPT